MEHETSAREQPVGFNVPEWRAPSRPSRESMEGHFCLVEPVNSERHAQTLFESYGLDTEGRNWTYLSYGPFEESAAFQAWLESFCRGDDPLFYAVVDRRTTKTVGLASYCRINPSSGCIEVGHINFSPLLQRTAAATEAMYLMMERVFALGFRRYEWKCDALNESSRVAAQRLGFSFEGIFRQATVYKGRNRDTAWYAVIDEEWPGLRNAFSRWLDPTNFDQHGRQRLRLSNLTKPTLRVSHS